MMFQNVFFSAVKIIESVTNILKPKRSGTNYVLPYDRAQKFCGEKMVANITRAKGQTTIGIASLSSR